MGWYLSERLTLPEKNLNNIFNQILKCAFYTSLFTFILMLVIWVPVSATLFDPAADFANFGIPMILYDPKISFIGWIILMIFISPFLTVTYTVFWLKYGFCGDYLKKMKKEENYETKWNCDENTVNF